MAYTLSETLERWLVSHQPPISVLLIEVSEHGAKKIAGVIIKSAAIRNVVRARAKYGTNRFGTQDISAIGPLVEQTVGNVVARPEQL